MKVLFEDGNWQLIDDKMWGATIYHRHHRDGGYDGYWWYYDDERIAVCGTCLEPVPKALIGLKILHNWDR